MGCWLWLQSLHGQAIPDLCNGWLPLWLQGEALTLGSSSLLSRHKGQGAMGFKAFVLELEDDITPHSAKAAYDKYLLDFWGSERIKVFQQKKGNPK